MLAKSLRQLLCNIGARNRQYHACDEQALRLERLGLIERVGGIQRHRITGAPAIEWTITAAGRAALGQTGTAVIEAR